MLTKPSESLYSIAAVKMILADYALKDNCFDIIREYGLKSSPKLIKEMCKEMKVFYEEEFKAINFNDVANRIYEHYLTVN